MTKIALIGEAWGEAEERERAPFVGAAGQELTRMLSDAGINRADCYLANVFNFRPQRNDIETLCCSEKFGNLPPIRRGSYLRTEFYGELTRLHRELSDLQPNVAVALGNTAAWALLGTTGISKIRGTVAESTTVRGLKVLPTYHPAAILRQWELRHVTVFDLMKARAESEFRNIRRPEREVYIPDNLADLESFYERYLRTAKELAVDIETLQNQITCIGFAPSASIALVIPFCDPRKGSGSFWPTLEEEVAAWNFVRRVCALPCVKIFQNGLYDCYFLWVSYGIPVANFDEDTMLLHHALQPESEKGLGFLGSVYTNEASWKLMRSRGTIKRED